jgi:hypothetical protein
MGNECYLLILSVPPLDPSFRVSGTCTVLPTSVCWDCGRRVIKPTAILLQTIDPEPSVLDHISICMLVVVAS